MNTQRKRTTRTLYQNAFKDTQNKPTLLEHTTSMLDANTYQDTLQHDFPRTGLPGHTTKTHDQAALRRTHSKTRTKELYTGTDYDTPTVQSEGQESAHAHLAELLRSSLRGAPQHNPDHPGYGRASAPHILTNALMRRGHSCPKMHHPPIGDIHLSLFLPYPNRPVARMSPA